MAFPRYKGPEGAANFCEALVEENGVLFLPSTIYSSALGETPTDRFRLCFGRSGIDEGLAALDNYLMANRQ
ncbi:MAG: hypothetical protein AB8B94_13315 [Hyphomicrobiales bacterium]